MNTLLSLGSGDLWQVAGWTMLHFLWLGALAGLAAGACRLVLRRAAAHVRYAAALVCLAVLAALPMAIAAWVGAKPQAMRMTESLVGVPPVEAAPAAPGSAGGFASALDEEKSAAIVPIVSHERVIIPSTDANPRQSRGLADVTATIAGYLPWLWIVGAPLTFLLLATGVVGAERLRRTSRVIEDGPIAEACARLIESLRIGRRVTVAVCERIVAPVLVGIVRPIILLPPAALTGWSPDEIEMVLLHELAHVRRWDNLVNLLQRLVEALLFFHPAVWLVSNWVRCEREACCDAIVVGRTSQPQAYAELLINLAAILSEPSEPGRPRPRPSTFRRRRGQPSSLVSTAMAAGPLRSRIRRILNLEDDPMLISSKSLGVVMGGLLLAATLLVLNLPERTTAEEPVQREDGKIATKAVDQELARQSEVTNRLKNLGLALHWYHDTKGSFPANASYDTFDRPLLSWRVHILPFLDGNAAEDGEAAALYKEFHLDEPWDSEHNQTLIARMPAVFQNPNRPPGGFTSYLAAVGSDCVFDGTAKGTSFAQIPDGTANTIMLVEADRGVEWTRPLDLKFNPAMPKTDLGNFRPNGWLAAFADGSVRLIRKDEPADKVRDLFTRGRQDTFVATQPAAPNERAPFPSPEDQTFAEVPFVLGATRFADGDKITITEVRGTAETIKPGNIYWIRGSYKLGSRDRAKLAANTTVKDAAHGTSASLSVQSTNVDRGEGTFTLFLPMTYRGWPHVSFYPADGGQSFGGIYFGTGESVLKESWGAKEAIDATAKDVAEYTEAQQSDEDVRRVTIAISDDQTATAESQPGRLRLQIRKTESKSGTFPTLEDQKLADLAWKGMGIELEKFGQSDSKRIKALGYDGGVKVVSTTDRVIGQPLQSGDVLIGLHVWPTTSLKDVAEVLNRDDLAELNPLKFYVLRDVGGGLGPARDAVVTGRISVSLDEQPRQRSSATDRYSAPTQATGSQSSSPSTYSNFGLQPAAAKERATTTKLPTADADLFSAPTPTDKPPLRYDGKTFYEWRNVWNVDGMTNSKLEALRALEAFSAAGYGKEAAWAIAYGAYSNDTSVAQHTRKCLSRLPTDDRLAVVTRLIDVLKTDLSPKRRIAAARALAAIGPNAEPALDILKKTLTSNDQQERIASAAAIKMIVGKDQYQKPVADVLGAEMGITVVESDGVWGALPSENAKDDGKAFNDFTEAVFKEQQQLFPDGKF